MKVFFDTVGCRLNQAEIEQLATEFRSAGHTIAESAVEADLVVINSCSVTAAAASDSRQKARQAEHAGCREIIFTGCLATLEPDDSRALPGIREVVPNAQKMNIAHVFAGVPELYELEPLARIPLPGLRKRTRAFIKVQDGCDNLCSFCVTRIARGKGVSMARERVLRDVTAAVDGGTREVVLSGVHLGSWGRDLGGGESLLDLVEYLLKNSPIERVRLSSTEPWDLDERFFELWQDGRMCRHLHLPLQSGSASVLKRMIRRTNPEAYRHLVDKAREMIPGVAITTDIITGFPGETEDEFIESLEFVKEMNFAGGHVFRYSPREGTAAAKIPGRVNGKVAIERSRLMREAIRRSQAAFLEAQIGAEHEVLWETTEEVGSDRIKIRGLTSNYLQACAVARNNRHGKIDRVQVTGVKGLELETKIIRN